jgi:hypothetical protein
MVDTIVTTITSPYSSSLLGSQTHEAKSLNLMEGVVSFCLFAIYLRKHLQGFFTVIYEPTVPNQHPTAKPLFISQ